MGGADRRRARSAQRAAAAREVGARRSRGPADQPRQTVVPTSRPPPATADQAGSDLPLFDGVRLGHARPRVRPSPVVREDRHRRADEYRNEAALMGLEQFFDFDPASQASALTTPTMVVHSDGCAFPEEAKKLYDGIQGDKELVWADGNHFDYYDSQAQIDNAVENVTRFFRIHLAEERVA